MTDHIATAKIAKVDTALGLVFGFAIVCKEAGEDHFDLQGHHIPEDVMLEAATDFAASDRVAKDMHSGEQTGQVLFMFPLTTDIAKAFGVETDKTGLMIAMKPSSAATLAKFSPGPNGEAPEFTGFSIGGKGKLELVE